MFDILVAIIAGLGHLPVGLLNLPRLTLVLEDLASLFSQELLLLLLQLPVLLLHSRFEVWLDFEQITVQFKLLCAHIEVLHAELLPILVSLFLLLLHFMFLLRQVTCVLTETIVIFEVEMAVFLTAVLLKRNLVDEGIQRL